MSYINDALKKAQKENNNQKYHYQPIIAGIPERRFRIKNIYVFAFLIILIIAATALTFWTVSQRQPVPETRLAKPAEVNPLPAARSGSGTVSLEPGKTETKAGTPLVGKTAVGQPGGAQEEQASAGSLPAQPVAREWVEPKGREGNTQKEVERLYREAIAAQKRKDLGAAKGLYWELLNLDPKYIKAVNNLGVIYMQESKGKDAVRMFERAISLKKDYVDPYYNMACLYAQYPDLRRSMKYLQAAAKINPEVKNWAKHDSDLKNIHTSPEFIKFTGSVDGEEQ